MSADIEKAILGAAYAYPNQFERFEATRLEARHFRDLRHGYLWDAITRTGAIDPVTGAIQAGALFDALTSEGRALWGSPIKILAYIADAPMMLEPAVYHARQLVDLSAREKLRAGLVEVLKSIDSDRDTETLFEKLDQVVSEERGEKRGKPLHYQHLVRDLFESMQRNDPPISMGTGIGVLDEYLKGFFGGELFVIGARPGIGKTALLTQLLNYSASQGAPCVFYSGEMSQREIMGRVLSQESGVNGSSIRNPSLQTERDARRLYAAAGTVSQLPVIVDEMSGRTIEELCSSAKRLVRTMGAKIIAFDYLQLISGSKDAKRLSRYQEISEVSRQLKQLAQDTKTIVVTLAQLNRAGDNQIDKRPQISHLRDSGQIEQDADMILLLSRNDPKKPETLLQIAKNRHGRIGDVTLELNFATTKFVSGFDGLPADSMAEASWQEYADQLND